MRYSTNLPNIVKRLVKLPQNLGDRLVHCKPTTELAVSALAAAQYW